MFTGLTLVTPPAIEPLGLDEVRQYRRIDATEEDNLLLTLIAVARHRCESFTGRALITQTWDLVRGIWPNRPRFGVDPSQPQPYPSCMLIPRSPLISVASVKYYDVTGAEFVMPATDYYVDTDSEPGRVALQYARIWPTTVLRPANGIRVRFTAGYGADATSVPAPLVQGIQYAVGHMHEHREEIGVARSAAAAFEIPQTCEALWWPYRIFTGDHF